MKTKIVITDLTRMQEQRVCVAGYDEQGCCIRPVLPPPGILECSLYTGAKPVVYPFAIIEYSLIRHTPSPPHTEDWVFDPGSIRFCGELEPSQRHQFLGQISSSSVESIFGQAIQLDGGYYVPDGAGARSLGAICLQQRPDVQVQVDGAGSVKTRVAFTDGAGAYYRLAVTDLAWRYCCDYLYRNEKLAADALAARLQARLHARDIFLRIGLARGWSQHPERCYLQITGIYTFPDYLEGRTFADFAPASEDDDW